MAIYTATEHSATTAPSVPVGDRIVPFSYTISGAITTGDIVNLCKYPPGFKPVGFNIKTSAGVATTGGTLKLGTNDGTTNDEDSLLASLTATGAVNVTQAPVTPTRAVDTCGVYATLAGTSGFTTGTTINGFVIVSPFFY